MLMFWVCLLWIGGAIGAAVFNEDGEAHPETGALVFCLGLFGLLMGAQAVEDAVASAKAEAIDKGHAHYVLDGDAAKWEWLPACAKPEPAD